MEKTNKHTTPGHIVFLILLQLSFFCLAFLFTRKSAYFQIQRCTYSRPFVRDECSSDLWINECVFDTNLGLKWDRTLKHSENRASVFSTKEGFKWNVLSELLSFCTVTFNSQLLQRDYCSLNWAFIISLKKRKSF